MGDDTDALIAIDHFVGSADVDVLGVEVLGVEVLDDVCVGCADDSDVVEAVPEQADATTRTQTRADGLTLGSPITPQAACTHA